MACIGYGQTHQQIKDKVQELCNQLKLVTPWKNNCPSDKWYCLFMARHPNLRYRMCQALAQERCGVSHDNLIRWFNELQQFMLEVGHPYLLDDASCIYNCDKTGFLMQPKPLKVITHKDDKHTYQVGTTSKKTQITVMLCNSATGHYIPPLVVYPGVQPRLEL